MDCLDRSCLFLSKNDRLKIKAYFKLLQSPFEEIWRKNTTGSTRGNRAVFRSCQKTSEISI